MKSSNFFPSMQDRSLTGNGSMNLCGDWMETETAIRLWSIFGKYGLNLQHIHYTIILKQSGGAGIGGTPEKHGAQKVFFALIPVLFACCVPITRYRHFHLSWYYGKLSVWWSGNSIRWFRGSFARANSVTAARDNSLGYCTNCILYPVSGGRIADFRCSLLSYEAKATDWCLTKRHYTDSE